MKHFHVSVLLQEVVDGLGVLPGKKYIDATVGGGGHALEIVKRNGKVLGIDWDEEALEYVKKINPNITLARGNFRDIEKIAKENGFSKVSGIIFDLGVSSHQLEDEKRGFSFQKEGPLDMRMSQDLQVRAADLINGLTKGELYELFTKMGEERLARPISNIIVQSRGVKKIETTSDLADIVAKAYGLKGKVSDFMKSKINKRVFQALRIAVNDELNNLRIALPASLNLLEGEGRLAVISFHSLEDRIVKRAFLDFEERNLGTIITKKPVVPSPQEVLTNRRSKSSKLRIFEVNK